LFVIDIIAFSATCKNKDQKREYKNMPHSIKRFSAFRSITGPKIRILESNM
jgi:hypothetical protein